MASAPPPIDMPGPGMPPSSGTPGRAPLWGALAGVLLTAVAVLAAAVSGPSGPDGAGATATTTGGVRTVQVVLGGMRISPSVIIVPSGTPLRLRVVNRDAQRHDLTVETGPHTALLGPGGSAVLDLGRITADRSAWCSVPGHRAAGMSMRITVLRATGHDHMAMPTASADAVSSGGFPAGWKARDASQAPAPAGTPHRVEIHAREADVEVAPGVRQRMWTFGGTVPGPVLRGRVGDTFEVTLVNDGSMGHGIDFHAGALSPDAAMRTVPPGGRLVYRFTADRSGAWLYHCSTAPMLQHIGNGMYGAVVVDPPDLAPVDHEYLLVSSEVYLGEPGSAAQVLKMRQDRPDAWVFNGAAHQYADAPLKARAGERVRFWVVAAGPSDGVAFHVVGTVFDTVYKEGAYLLRTGDPGGSQVLDLAVAQGGFVETVFPAAGHYSFVDHDMRHADAGAHGMVEVTP